MGKDYIKILPSTIEKDISRVILIPFDIESKSRIEDIYDRVGRLSASEVEAEFQSTVNLFKKRHDNIENTFEIHYNKAMKIMGKAAAFSKKKKLLLGAYLSMEYSFQGAALFNPSITIHPDQNGIANNSLKIIMSFRALGEGHISSVIFMIGTIDKNGNLTFDTVKSIFTKIKAKHDSKYNKQIFSRKLKEMGDYSGYVEQILSLLGNEFTFKELENSFSKIKKRYSITPELENNINSIRTLAHANYELQLAANEKISDIMIFPYSQLEAKGIEDLRLTLFTDEKKNTTYFGTYTAYNGQNILPMIMETRDFRTIAIHTLNGACAKNKGMALFPNKINNHYCMCSRLDGHNLYIMYSDLIHFWESATLLATPKYPWEMRLIGNCGSPIKTSEGWLLITHGVGPVRRYSIGAMLLDLDDPTKIIGRLKEPLLSPLEEDREGYVPNVVYSCGSIIHNNILILPFGAADTITKIAKIDVKELLQDLKKSGA